MAFIEIPQCCSATSLTVRGSRTAPGGCASSHAKMCARTTRCASSCSYQNYPYPLRSGGPSHHQHESVRCTCALNLTRTLSGWTGTRSSSGSGTPSSGSGSCCMTDAGLVVRPARGCGRGLRRLAPSWLGTPAGLACGQLRHGRARELRELGQSHDRRCFRDRASDARVRRLDHALCGVQIV